VLDRERNEVPEGVQYRELLLRAATPIWALLLVIGGGRYRVSSSSAEANAAWSRIRAQLFERERQAA